MERDKDPPVVTMINNPDPTFIEWNATDNKGIKTIYYTIDDTIPGYTAPKITIPQSGKKQLILSLGRHRIDIIAEDAFRLKGKATQYKDITTAIEPPTTIDSLILYPNPAEDIMHIKYKTNMSQNAYRTIYTLDGKPVERKTIGQMTEEDLDITTLKKGMYIMNIIDGKDRQSIKFIKK
jgi:hypothetical protein